MLKKISEAAMREGMKLMSDPRVTKWMSDPRVMNAVGKAFELQMKVKGAVEEQLKPAVARIRSRVGL